MIKQVSKLCKLKKHDVCKFERKCGCYCHEITLYPLGGTKENIKKIVLSRDYQEPTGKEKYQYCNCSRCKRISKEIEKRVRK